MLAAFRAWRARRRLRDLDDFAPVIGWPTCPECGHARALNPDCAECVRDCERISYVMREVGRAMPSSEDLNAAALVLGRTGFSAEDALRASRRPAQLGP